MKLFHHADGRTTCGLASHIKYEGFHVLRLKGSPYDLAFQHGALLAHVIGRGPLPFFASYLDTFLRHSSMGRAGSTVASVLQRVLRARVVERWPPFLRATAAGLSDGAGLPEELVLKAFAMPDAVLHAVSLFGRLTGVPAAAGCACPPLGCTSAVAGPSRTRGGKLLHARNLDFTGVGRWDAEPVIAFHEPDDGLPFVGLSAAGLVGGGITGMNSAGLTFVVHQHFPTRVDLDGEPVGLIGERILREAHSVDEAITLLDRHRPMGGWTYVVSDPERAIAYEVLPGARRIVKMVDDCLGYANAYQHPDLVAAEHDVYPAYRQANHARHRRVWAALREVSSEHSETTLAEILDDHSGGRPAGERPAVFGDTIRTPYTVQSVIFRPSDRKFWVGQGPAPTSAGPYLGFDLETRGPAPSLPVLRPRDGRLSPSAAASEAYARAYRAFLEYDDVKAARQHVSDALSSCPDDDRLHHAAGLLALRDRDLAAAERHFGVAALRANVSARRARGHLGRAWALEALGRSAEARSERLAARHAEVEDPTVGGLLGRRMGDLGRIPIELLYADVP